MTDIDEAVRMTPADIGVMREIIAWRKNREIEFVRNRTLGTYWVDAFGTTGAKRRSVAIEWRSAKPLGTAASSYESYEWFAPASFRQAVDMLVALGYLPARFSSAYRAGWHAAEVWYDPDEAHGGDEFKRLFHDPANISFPAVPE